MLPLLLAGLFRALAADPDELDRQIKRLGDDDFETREAAQQQLTHWAVADELTAANFKQLHQVGALGDHEITIRTARIFAWVPAIRAWIEPLKPRVDEKGMDRLGALTIKRNNHPDFLALFATLNTHGVQLGEAFGPGMERRHPRDRLDNYRDWISSLPHWDFTTLGLELNAKPAKRRDVLIPLDKAGALLEALLDKLAAPASPAPVRAEVDEVIKQIRLLGDQAFEVRDAASAELRRLLSERALTPQGYAEIRRGSRSADRDIRRRVDRLLDQSAATPGPIRDVLGRLRVSMVGGEEFQIGPAFGEADGADLAARVRAELTTVRDTVVGSVLHEQAIQVTLAKLRAYLKHLKDADFAALGLVVNGAPAARNQVDQYLEGLPSELAKALIAAGAKPQPPAAPPAPIEAADVAKEIERLGDEEPAVREAASGKLEQYLLERRLTPQGFAELRKGLASPDLEVRSRLERLREKARTSPGPIWSVLDGLGLESFEDGTIRIGALFSTLRDDPLAADVKAQVDKALGTVVNSVLDEKAIRDAITALQAYFKGLKGTVADLALAFPGGPLFNPVLATPEDIDQYFTDQLSQLNALLVAVGAAQAPVVPVAPVPAPGPVKPGAGLSLDLPVVITPGAVSVTVRHPTAAGQAPPPGYEFLSPLYEVRPAPPLEVATSVTVAIDYPLEGAGWPVVRDPAELQIVRFSNGRLELLAPVREPAHVDGLAAAYDPGLRSEWSDQFGAFALVQPRLEPLDRVVLDLPAGFSAIANNFRREGNTLADVLPSPAAGTTVYLWTPGADGYSAPQTYDDLMGGWDGNPTAPFGTGDGAFLLSPRPQQIVFSGEVREMPARARLPAGFYLVGTPAPRPMRFPELMRFPPLPGDRVHFPLGPGADSLGQPFRSCTFGTGGWDVEPIVLPGQAVFVELLQDSAELLGGDEPIPALFAVESRGNRVRLTASPSFTGPRARVAVAASATGPYSEVEVEVQSDGTTQFVELEATDAMGFFQLRAPAQAEDCECKDLTVGHVIPTQVLQLPAPGGKTTVTMDFLVSGLLTCGAKEGSKCKGRYQWKLAAASDWGKGVTSIDTIDKGAGTVSARCDGKASKVAAALQFQATVSAQPPLQGKLSMPVSAECPIGTKKVTRDIIVIIDTALPNGINRDASDLDGDGLTGAEEKKKRTNPENWDTDGDGVDDGKDAFPLDPKKSKP